MSETLILSKSRRWTKYCKRFVVCPFCLGVVGGNLEKLKDKFELLSFVPKIVSLAKRSSQDAFVFLGHVTFLTIVNMVYGMRRQ